MSYFLIKVAISIAALFSFIGNVQAAEVMMTVTQQQSLGVSMTPVGKNTGLSSRRFPAEIVVPVGQVRMVSAPQPGLLDQLYVATGQEVKKGQIVAHLTSADLLGLQKKLSAGDDTK